MNEKELKNIANQLGKISDKLEKLIKTLKESSRDLIEDKPQAPQIGSTGDFNTDKKSDK